MDAGEFARLLDDLGAEATELLQTLSGLSRAEWSLPTPAPGWNIHDQVVHLAYFDDLVALGFSDPEGFAARATELESTGRDWVDRLSHDRADIPSNELIDWFARSRGDAIAQFERLGPAARTPWFGPSMSAASSASARLMETWAHGQDVYDALGLARDPTARIRHVCHLGVITRRFSYDLRGRNAPDAAVRVELVAPDGTLWTWGPPDSSDRVTGSALDFALVVTQRRHLHDTGLQATAGSAAEWTSLAQVFAGSAGSGRKAGDFPNGRL